jgi:hypothetical protein
MTHRLHHFTQHCEGSDPLNTVRVYKLHRQHESISHKLLFGFPNGQSDRRRKWRIVVKADRQGKHGHIFIRFYRKHAPWLGRCWMDETWGTLGFMSFSVFRCSAEYYCVVVRILTAWNLLIRSPRNTQRGASIVLPILNTALGGGVWSTPRHATPRRFTLVKEPRYESQRMLGHGLSGLVSRRERLIHTGVPTPDHPARSESLRQPLKLHVKMWIYIHRLRSLTRNGISLLVQQMFNTHCHLLGLCIIPFTSFIPTNYNFATLTSCIPVFKVSWYANILLCRQNVLPYFISHYVLFISFAARTHTINYVSTFPGILPIYLNKFRLVTIFNTSPHYPCVIKNLLPSVGSRTRIPRLLSP